MQASLTDYMSHIGIVETACPGDNDAPPNLPLPPIDPHQEVPTILEGLAGGELNAGRSYLV